MVSSKAGDGELKETIEAIKAGNVDQFGTIVRHYQRQLLTHATYMLGDAATAEDAVQETFVAVFKYINTFDHDRAFNPWIFMILKNICKKYRRKLWLRPLSMEAITETMEFPAEEDVEKTALSRDFLKRLGDEILKLPGKYREVFLLRHVNGLAYSEIAETIEVSVEVVKVRLFRARRMLKGKLDA